MLSKDRPAVVTDEHLRFLDEVREIAQINMFAAAPLLQEEFGLERKEAQDVLKYWAATFGDRQKQS